MLDPHATKEPLGEKPRRVRRIRGAEFRSSRLSIDDLTLVVQRFPPRPGAPTEPSFVLVHGIGVSSRYFGPAAAELARFGAVYVVDLPGYGSSPRPRRDVSLADHAEVLASLLRALDLPNPVLVGHSMGTQVITQLAVDHPEVTDRIVLMGPTMPPDARSPLTAAWRLFTDTLREPPRANAIVITDYLWRCGPRYYFQQLPHLLRDRIEDRLPRIGAKTLVINGDRDPVARTEWARRVTDLVPGATLRIVDGPHVVMFTDPVGVATAIAEHAAR